MKLFLKPMKKEIKEAMEKFAISEFEKKSEAINIPMSDGATIRIYRSIPAKEKFNGYSMIVMPGWGTVVPAWDQFLLEAVKDFDVIYFESREKGSSDLPKTAKVGMERMAFDIHDIIKHLKLDESKVVLFGSCIGATTIAYGMFKNMYNPYLPVLVAPPARFEFPPVFRQLIPISPTFLWGAVQPIVRLWITKFKSNSPEQAAKYLRAAEEADAKKWKRLGLRLAFKRYWKMFPQVKNHVLLVAAEADKMDDAKVTKKVDGLMENSTYVNLRSNKETHSPVMVNIIREYLPKFSGKNH